MAWMPKGLSVTYTEPVGEEVAANVIAPSPCGEFVAIDYSVEGHVVRCPNAPSHRIHVCVWTP